MKTLALLVTVIVIPFTAMAGPMAPPMMEGPDPIVEESPWRVSTVLYGFVPAVTGETGIAGFNSDVDADFGDVLGDTDMAFFAYGEVGYQRWFAGVDVLYGNLSQDTQLKGTVPALFFKSARVDFEQWTITPRIGYRIYDSGDYLMDAYVGARWTYNEAGLTLRRQSGGQIQRSASRDWWDPVVGVRGRKHFADDWFFHYNGEIGGFGVNSDLVWNATLAVGYNITDNVSLNLGYRGIGVDYEKSGYKNDTIQHGPVFGLVATF